MEEQVKKTDKTIGLVSYLGPVGWIIAYVMFTNDKSNRTEFNIFHLRQGLGASIFAVAGYIVALVIGVIFGLIGLYFIGNLLTYAVYILSVVFFIMGLINASNGQEKHLPMLGEKFEEMFKGFIK